MKKLLTLVLTLTMLLSVAIVPNAALAGNDGVFTDVCSWPPVNTYIANYYAPNSTGWQIDSMTNEGMFALVAVSGVVYPRLAESYEQDEYTDTIHLRQDVKYNDGDDFTAKDIWSYYILNNGCTVTQQAKSIEIIDDYTIKFTWREQINPSVRLRMIATNVDARIPYHIFGEYVDKAAELLATGVDTENAANRKAFGKEYTEETLAALDANWQAFIQYGPENQIPVGTGSYMVSKMTDTDCIMVKNPYYYNYDLLGFEAIHFVNVDTDTKLAMLQNGDLSRSDGTPAKDVLEGILAGNEALVHYLTLDNASVGVSIDVQDPNLSKPEVRQAICYVLDRDAIREVGNYYGFTATYAELGMPESYVRNDGWVNEDALAKMTQYETNPEKATELLESVGWTKKDDGWYNENDEKISWTTISTSEFQFLNAAQIFSQQLTAFGLNTELKVLEPSVFTATYNTDGEREYEFACNWIDNCWGVYCPYGPLQDGYYKDQFASIAGNFPKFTEGARKGEINMVYPDYNGEETDIAALLKTMLAMTDEEMVDAASRISYITNENVFSIAFFQNSSGYWLNQNDIEGLPLPDKIEPSGRNVMLPEDPEELSIINDHWYIWVAEGLVISNGTYQAK
ncbi:MAG: hypothetical protein E7317_09350 [Clostridiales bacterium]|nr:hypothetical protein [Clostridiales bacterium]